MLAISHRVQQFLNYDRVLVLRRVVDSQTEVSLEALDTPRQLLKIGDGYFALQLAAQQMGSGAWSATTGTTTVNHSPSYPNYPEQAPASRCCKSESCFIDRWDT